MISRFFKSKPKRVELPNGKPYPLHAGRRLRALEEVEVLIPAAILEPPGTPLSDLVQLSDDDAQVGFIETEKGSGRVSHIVVLMKPTMEICLGRNCEIVTQSAGQSSAWEELD